MYLLNNIVHRTHELKRTMYIYWRN